MKLEHNPTTNHEVLPTIITPPYHLFVTPPIRIMSFVLQQTTIEDDVIMCRFRRPQTVPFHHKMQSTPPVDLTAEWYQLYAWGSLSSGTYKLHVIVIQL